MTRRVARRGPDDEGVTLFRARGAEWVDLATDATVRAVDARPVADAGGYAHDLAFGHRRFSIVDLSAHGHQPFWSSAGDVCVAFNGEVYNHVELRHELEALGHTFRSTCDTEVLVEAYRAWGTACFARFVGFWALSLYDARKKRLLLARDRIGKAPLYWARTREGLFWGSEIDAVREGAGAENFPVRRQAVTDFVLNELRDYRHDTFYEGIRSLEPACFAWVRADGTFEPEFYWHLPTERARERDVDANDMARQLRELLEASVRLRLRADVPVGLELSGGMDSSALVALAAQTSSDLHVYVVSFPGTDSDEEPYARMVYERHRGRLQYHVLHPGNEDFVARADDFVAMMAEPFHSVNVFTNYQIWQQMAAQGLRVSINGAAGDEDFAGYSMDYHIPYLEHLVRHGHLVRAAREASLFSESPAPVASRQVAHSVGRALYGMVKYGSPAYRRRIEAARTRRFESVPLRGVPAPTARKLGDMSEQLLGNMADWKMNYWLRSGNQAFMSVPLEVRAPFLDHRVVEFAFRLPLGLLVRDGYHKWILRKAVEDMLPREVTWRGRKMGFPFPYRAWLHEMRPALLGLIRGLDCPVLDLPRLEREYDTLLAADPVMLWRVLSTALWYKRCVQGLPLR